MKTVVGLFDRLEDAQQVVEELRDGGFNQEDISLIARDESGEYGRLFEGKSEDISDGAAAGAGTGAVLGGLGGLLLGLGVIALPGIGAVLAAGPLVATLAGAGIGALAGGLVGALIDLGIPDDYARVYSEGVRRGGTLVVVEADDRKAELAATVMNRHNPVDLDPEAGMWQEEADAAGLEREVHAAELPVTGQEALDYGDLEEDLHQHRNLDDRLHIEEKGVDPTGESFFDREVEDVPPTGDPRIDRSADVTELDNTTIPLTGSSQDNPFVKEGPFDEGDYETESARHPLDNIWREHFHAHLDDGRHFYADYQLAYRFGQNFYGDSRFADYRTYSWEQVEPEARQEWEMQGIRGAWENVREAVRYAWEYVKSESGG